MNVGVYSFYGGTSWKITYKREQSLKQRLTMKYATIFVTLIRHHIDIEKYINNIIRRSVTESEYRPQK
jgi:hypothetical protein